MMMTDYQRIERSERQLVRQEELILAVTESLVDALVSSGMKRSGLAMKLGRTKSYVSQLLGGGSNLTLRTLADVAEAMGMRVNVELEPKPVRWENWGRSKFGRVLPMRFPCKQKEGGLAEDSTAGTLREAGAW